MSNKFKFPISKWNRKSILRRWVARKICEYILESGVSGFEVCLQRHIAPDVAIIGPEQIIHWILFEGGYECCTDDIVKRIK